MSWRVGTLATVVIEGQELAGEVMRVEGNLAYVAVRIPHARHALFPAGGQVLWPDGREQPFAPTDATATTVVEIALPLLQEEVRAEVQLRRKLAVDVRTPDQKLVASGHTRTCSASGAKLDLNRPLVVGERYRLGLYLPEGVLKLAALVLRNDPAGRAIVTFQELTPAQRQALESFVAAGLAGVRQQRGGTTE